MHLLNEVFENSDDSEGDDNLSYDDEISERQHQGKRLKQAQAGYPTKRLRKNVDSEKHQNDNEDDSQYGVAGAKQNVKSEISGGLPSNQQYESGSEEEFVPGATLVATNNTNQNQN